MGAYPERSPLNQPFKGAEKVLKDHLLTRLNECFANFKREKNTKSAMSAFLRLYEDEFLKSADEIGGQVALHMQQFIQLCSDYANGHGKIEALRLQFDQLCNYLKS